MALLKCIASLRNKSLRSSVLDTDVHKYLPGVECIQDYLGYSSDRERAVNAGLRMFGMTNLAVILVDNAIHGIPDRLHHVIVVEWRVRPLEEVHVRAFQATFHWRL